MASINLSGVLRDPLGEVSFGNKVRFTHTTTTGETLKGFRSIEEVVIDGAYDIDLEYGNVSIETFDKLNRHWVYHGNITINSDTPATSLPALLGITTPATDADLLVFQALVADAESAALSASDSATEAGARLDSYEVASADYLINSLDASSLAIGSVVKALGFYSRGDGGNASWIKTAVTGASSQTPAQLGNALLNDSSGGQWSLLTKGTINVKSLGAVNGTTSAKDSTIFFTAMQAHCLATGDAWKAKGDFYVTAISAYTENKSSCTLYSDNNGSSDAVFTLLPLPADVNPAEDTAPVQAALPFYRGQSKIPALGVHKGKVLRIACADIYLPRSSALATSYRYEMYCYVVNDAGDITPSVPFDWPDTVTISILESELLQDVIDISNITTKLTSGVAGNRAASIRSSRSNVKHNSLSTFNASGLFSLQGVNLDGVMYNTLMACSANGAGVNTTNYGYNFTGASNKLIGCSESDNRRGSDQNYHNDLQIIGGSYPSGIGAHFGFNTVGSDISHIGFTAANPVPLHFTGGSAKFSKSTIITQSNLFDIRSDGPELLGSVSITDCELIFDLTDATGSPVIAMFTNQLPALGYDYPAGRDIHFPEKITYAGNTVNVLGVGHTAIVQPLYLFSQGSIVEDILLDSQITFDNNTYNFENGSNSLKLTTNKLSSFSASSAGINIDFLDNIDTLVTYFGNTQGSAGVKLNLYAPNVKASANVRADYGWLDKSYVTNGVYSAAVGATYESSSRWLTRKNKEPWSMRFTIADDSALEVSGYGLYNSVEFFELNDTTLYGKVFIDGSGISTLAIAYASAKVETLSETALTGTTGTDTKFTLSQIDDVLYMENRTGSSAPMHIVFNEAVV